MPRRTDPAPPPAPEPAVPVTAGDEVVLPPAREVVAQVATAVPTTVVERVSATGAASNRYGAKSPAIDAFRVFVEGKGEDPDRKRPLPHWTPMLDEFDARPVLGHRRRSADDNHLSNASHVRR